MTSPDENPNDLPLNLTISAAYVLLFILQDADRPVTVPDVAERLSLRHEDAVHILDFYKDKQWLAVDIAEGEAKRDGRKPPKRRLYRLTSVGVPEARVEVRSKCTMVFSDIARSYELDLDVLNEPGQDSEI